MPPMGMGGMGMHGPPPPGMQGGMGRPGMGGGSLAMGMGGERAFTPRSRLGLFLRCSGLETDLFLSTWAVLLATYVCSRRL